MGTVVPFQCASCCGEFAVERGGICSACFRPFCFRHLRIVLAEKDARPICVGCSEELGEGKFQLLPAGRPDARGKTLRKRKAAGRGPRAIHPAGIRAVYFDVDATLVDDERRFHPRNLAAIRAVRARGVKVGLATGRSFSSARPYAQAIYTDAPLVLYNGCQVADPDTGRVLHETPLALEDARRALELLAGTGLHVNLYAGGEIYIKAVTPQAEESMRKDGVVSHPVGDLIEFLKDPPTKILIIGPGEKLEDFAARLRARYRSRPMPELVRSEPTYLEILPNGVSKGRGMLEACRIQGIERGQVVAFGDNLNDREMLAWAGLGVAMGNGHPGLKAVADRVIGDNAGDAIATFLEELFTSTPPA